MFKISLKKEKHILADGKIHIEYDFVSAEHEEYQFSFEEIQEVAEGALRRPLIPYEMLPDEADYFKIVNGELMAYQGTRSWVYSPNSHDWEGYNL